MKKLYIAVFCVLFLVSVSKGGWLYFSEKELAEYAENGNKIVQALKGYHKKEKHYPEKLEELVPEYLKEIPLSKEGDGESFIYYKIPEDDPKKDEYYYGFLLSVFADNWRMLLTPRSAKRLNYNPSEKYPLRKWTKPRKLIGNWSYAVSYRRYGDPTNPMILKDGKPIFLDE
ncbi:MAG: hypothetical protein V3V05_11860 [Pontiella sp.]